MSIAWTIAIKDLKLLIRDKMGLFWVFAFPLIYALFFGSIFGGGERASMSIGVEDRDRTAASKQFVERLKASPSLQVVEMTRDDAFRRVGAGKLVAFLVLETGFGDPAGMFGGSAKMEMGVDPARQAEQGFLQGLVMESYFAGVMKQFTDPAQVRAQMQKLTAQIDQSKDLGPVESALLKQMFGSIDKVMAEAKPATLQNGPQFKGPQITMTSVADQQDRPRKSFEFTFPSAILWGILGCSAAFAVSLVTERIEGTFFRLKVGPITRGQILAGKALACFLTCMAVQAVLIAVGATVFGVRIVRPAMLLVAVLSTAACFVGLMMLVSTFGRTQQSVSGAGWGMNTVLAMLGGGMVPLFAMPKWMFQVGSISPVKWSILATESAIWRQQVAWPEFLSYCLILLGFGVAGLAGGAWILRRTEA